MKSYWVVIDPDGDPVTDTFTHQRGWAVQRFLDFVGASRVDDKKEWKIFQKSGYSVIKVIVVPFKKVRK